MWPTHGRILYHNGIIDIVREKTVSNDSLVTCRIDSLRYSCPFRKFCRLNLMLAPIIHDTYSKYKTKWKNVLWIPFRYFRCFLSKIVYLSFGFISASVGISSFQTSTAFVIAPIDFKALSTVSTIRSTRIKRCRCLYFWCLESRQGVFLESSVSNKASSKVHKSEYRTIEDHPLMGVLDEMLQTLWCAVVCLVQSTSWSSSVVVVNNIKILCSEIPVIIKISRLSFPSSFDFQNTKTPKKSNQYHRYTTDYIIDVMVLTLNTMLMQL